VKDPRYNRVEDISEIDAFAIYCLHATDTKKHKSRSVTLQNTSNDSRILSILFSGS
jgi:hypothetical protein